MDIPGLYEPDDSETGKNAEKLTEAPKRGHSYILYFILKVTDRVQVMKRW